MEQWDATDVILQQTGHVSQPARGGGCCAATLLRQGLSSREACRSICQDAARGGPPAVRRFYGAVSIISAVSLQISVGKNGWMRKEVGGIRPPALKCRCKTRVDSSFLTLALAPVANEQAAGSLKGHAVC